MSLWSEGWGRSHESSTPLSSDLVAVLDGRNTAWSDYKGS